MTPKRPYLLRAFYEWILDNDMTPHILVNAAADSVSVPKQHVKDGRIVLNISPSAIQDFVMDNDAVSFSARFGGVAFYVYCPIYSILAIYSRETQDGASFPENEYAHLEATPTESDGVVDAVSEVKTSTNAAAKKAKSRKKPQLSQVSTGDDTEVDATANTHSDSNDNDKPPPKTRPSLRVVK